MKAMLICAALAATTSAAHAVERYQASTLTCSTAQAAIHTKGAVIIHFPAQSQSAPPTYGRFVANVNQCDTGNQIASSSIPTKDDLNCKVSSCQRYRSGHD